MEKAEQKTRICVVTCAERLRQGKTLAARVSGYIVADMHMQGSLAGHRIAIYTAHAMGGRWIIMEDDAIPVDDFLTKAQAIADRFPDDLVSLYLGTGRPPQYQDYIRQEVEAGAEFLHMSQLIHGVCYMLPDGAAGKILDHLEKGPADFAIGKAWNSATGRGVIYPVASLADHADGESVECHPDGQPRSEPRRAWRLHQ